MAWHEQPRGTGTLNDGRDHFDLRREGFRLIAATFAIGVTLGILLTIIAITAADRLGGAA
jgi:hypothetical protein